MSKPRSVWDSFLKDEGAFILASESLLLGTICVIGLIVGLAEVRNAVVQELGDFSGAVAQLSQDYAFTSVSSTNGVADIRTSGSVYADDLDNQLDDTFEANGVVVDTTADVE